MVNVEISLLVFAVSLLVGGFGIHVGSKVALKSKSFSHAIVTALFGAIAWAIVELAFAEIGIGGLLSSVVAFLVWMWVIRRRYNVGWLRASLLAFGAWVGAVLALFVLALFNLGSIEAVGVPGV